VMPRLYSVVRLGPRAKVPAGLTGFHSVTRTASELSVVCRQELVPFEVAGTGPQGLHPPQFVAGTGPPGPAPAAVQRRREDGFRCLEVAGPLPFEATGVLAALATPLARAGIPILAISTFDTDYLLVREQRFREAVRALEGGGHAVAVR
jgi:hypothetical protein